MRNSDYKDRQCYTQLDNVLRSDLVQNVFTFKIRTCGITRLV